MAMLHLFLLLWSVSICCFSLSLLQLNECTVTPSLPLTLDISSIALNHVNQVVNGGVLLEQKVAVVNLVLLKMGKVESKMDCTFAGYDMHPGHAPVPSSVLVAAAAVTEAGTGQILCINTFTASLIVVADLQDALYCAVVQVGEGQHGVDGYAARLLLLEENVGRFAV